MSSPLPSPARFSDRACAAGEWVLVLGLAATFAWTTLCLGGYLAQTMVVSGTAILSLGALGVILWAAGRRGEPRLVNRAVFVPVPFLLYALAGVLWWAPAGWLAWREWLLWLQMWVVFALALHFGRGRAQTGVLAGTFVLLVVVGLGMAIYQRFSDPNWMMLGRKQAVQFHTRSSAMFGIPNSFAALLELVIPVCLTLLFSRAVKASTKIICGWLAGLSLVALALTGSRGGWLGLALALLIWPLLATRHWHKKLIGAVALSVLIFGGLWALYRGSDFARERMEPFLDGRFELSRPKVWGGAVRIWQDHPWIGTGAASFNVMFDQYRPRQFADEPVWAHNDYLNTLSDYGLVGFVLWAGAGAALLWLGWLGIRRTQRAGTSVSNLFGLTKWKLGLLVGLLAFALHLVVDFHTKIPALAYAAAIVMAWLLRDEASLTQRVSRVVAGSAGVLLGVVLLGLAFRVGLPLYRAEAIRFEARRSIDRYATSLTGDLAGIAAAARANLSQAVRIDPANGQAWADLAYTIALSARGKDENRVATGRFAELAAGQALELCPINAEFWVRKGVALDLQRGRPEAENCYRRAVELAPNSPAWWYYYACHLQGFSERKDDARAAIETCLALDPYYRGAESLRQQLTTAR